MVIFSFYFVNRKQKFDKDFKNFLLPSCIDVAKDISFEAALAARKLQGAGSNRMYCYCMQNLNNVFYKQFDSNPVIECQAELHRKHILLSYEAYIKILSSLFVIWFYFKVFAQSIIVGFFGLEKYYDINKRSVGRLGRLLMVQLSFTLCCLLVTFIVVLEFQAPHLDLVDFYVKDWLLTSFKFDLIQLCVVNFFQIFSFSHFSNFYEIY